MTVADVSAYFATEERPRSYSVVEAGRLLGLALRTDALGWRQRVKDPEATYTETLPDRTQPVVYSDLICITVADMAVQSEVCRIAVAA
jgi:hypothetical protein